MNATLSLGQQDDLDTLMLKIARDVVMGMHSLEEILAHHALDATDFNRRIKGHPRFNSYLASEKEAWNAATNTPERVKLKASAVMEDWMLQAHTELHDKKTPLNQKVELGKLLAKLAGMGEPKPFLPGQGGGGFHLQINIAPGAAPAQMITIRQELQALEQFAEDDYDPMVSPDSLEGF